MSRSSQLTVRVLEPQEHLAAAAVAARALRDSPTTVASYGEDAMERMARTYRTYAGLFDHVSTPQVGALCGSCPIGVAIASPPGKCVGALFGDYAADVLARPAPDIGDPAREQVFWARWTEDDLPEDHWHIGPVGVEPGFQGRGIGAAIMRELCSRLDEGRAVGWLETDKEINVRFYLALGFEIVERTEILEVPTWYMRRDPAPTP